LTKPKSKPYNNEIVDLNNRLNMMLAQIATTFQTKYNLNPKIMNKLIVERKLRYLRMNKLQTFTLTNEQKNLYTAIIPRNCILFLFLFNFLFNY
jgi:hypothetical protein